jgi:hypothetical protein
LSTTTQTQGQQEQLASLETPFFGRAQAIMSAPTEGDYNSKRVKTQDRAANNRRQNAPKKKSEICLKNK